MAYEKRKKLIFSLSTKQNCPRNNFHRSKILITFSNVVVIVVVALLYSSFARFSGREAIYTVINCILRFADKTLPSLSTRAHTGTNRIVGMLFIRVCR